MSEIDYNLRQNDTSINNLDIDDYEDNRLNDTIERSDSIDSPNHSSVKRYPKQLNDSSENEDRIKLIKQNSNDLNKKLEPIDENPSEDMATNTTAATSMSDDSDRTARLLPESQFTPHMRDRFRRKLRFHFMSPIDKWRAKRRFPFKLLVQIIKILLVTSQLTVFGFDMSNHLDQEINVVTSFRELFLSNWDPVREVMAYPPAAGPFAIYTKDDFYESVDYAIRQFSNISDMSIGSFDYAINRTANKRNMSDIIVRRQHYATGDAEPSDYVYVYDNEIVTDFLEIGELFPPNDQRWQTNFSSLEYFNSNNFSLNFDRLLLIELIFPLRTIYLNSLAKYNAPKCYDLNVSIIFDNTEHDGQMPIQLTTHQRRHLCDGNLVNSDEDNTEKFRRQFLNWSAIVFCMISSLLCIRSLYSGQLLRCETQEFFGRHFQKRLTFEEKTDFIDLWIVMIIVNDALILIGSVMKMQMESKIVENVHYTDVSILLGVGNLFVWAGLLRYLGFFHKYNILILTLRKAIPNVLRFMMCALLLYGGFCFCGWVVLGPYHLKFRTLSRASECLFSLMNGDDMFATFYITDAPQTSTIWWFSRLYLYLFVCLFIYVVLSLFIALIMDSYETIKDYYENGMPLNDLKKFISECTDESTSRAYIEDRQTSIADTFNLCFDCLSRRTTNYRNI